MAKQPEDRFQSVSEFSGALKAAAQVSSAPEHPESIADATMSDAHEAFVFDGVIELPNSANLTDSRRKADIEAWQRITNSQHPADFNRYLQEFPAGEFAELARLRIESLKTASARAQVAEEQARLEHEAQARAALEEKMEHEAAQRVTLEKAQAQAKALAEAEAKRQRDTAEKARLVSQLAEIKNMAETARASGAVTREKANKAQAQRAQELSTSLPERARKFAETVEESEAATDAERRMKMAAERKLEEEVQRKRQTKMQLLSKREAADAKAVADVEEKRQREAAELVARKNELAEAKAQAEVAERLGREAEERAVLAHQRTRTLIITGGAVLSVLLIGILVALVLYRK